MGYTTKATVAGFNFVSPTFKNVSGAAISCQDITLSGENAIEYVDTLQILDEGGATTETYFWTVDNGWQDEDGNKCTKALNPGDGVLISTLQDAVTVTFAGAVGEEDIKLISVAGFNFVGNATPVEIEAQDLTLSGDNAIEYVDTLQVLDEGGATIETYFWTVDNGWQDEDGNKCTKALGAGEGVLISTLQDGVEINIPSAL